MNFMSGVLLTLLGGGLGCGLTEARATGPGDKPGQRLHEFT